MDAPGDETHEPSSADALQQAYEDGFAAAERGEEAAPGCTTTAAGRAWLRGYVEGAKARAGSPDP
jgi:hypothetical protein